MRLGNEHFKVQEIPFPSIQKVQYTKIFQGLCHRLRPYGPYSGPVGPTTIFQDFWESKTCIPAIYGCIVSRRSKHKGITIFKIPIGDTDY